ncbi:MAG: ABC transporter ATP-binding protein [Corallococcus sp.]|nr:ABC transporter ATP-binding protein [Corallococcus sp.]
MSLVINNLYKKYSDAPCPLFDGLNAEFKKGKVYAIVGASGSGKTTLLNIIARLTDFGGQVTANGDISYVFQTPTFYKNITVKNNLKLALAGTFKDKNILNDRIRDYLHAVELDEYADKYPDMLSGGQLQRAALARAFAYPSEILLMDEPFCSLDYGVKSRVIRQFLKLQSANRRTVLFVTHDVDEAFAVADEILLLSQTPATLCKIAELDDDKTLRDIYSAEYCALKRTIAQAM